VTIDERIERLTERHEALAQSIELMVATQKENDSRYHERFQKNEDRLGQLMDSMNRLVRVVEIHEHRLDNLEQ
jgi:DNA repair exonuclease SbcCD ATPase subunit